ncbi:UNVERIFIED_CONTAM: hypothetical protein FKN15_062590 [Acipenser sinensis]
MQKIGASEAWSSGPGATIHSLAFVLHNHLSNHSAGCTPHYKINNIAKGTESKWVKRGTE